MSINLNRSPERALKAAPKDSNFQDIVKAGDSEKPHLETGPPGGNITQAKSINKSLSQLNSTRSQLNWLKQHLSNKC